MVLELPRSVDVPPLVALDREFDHDDVDDYADGYAPTRSFATAGQDRLAQELVMVLRASIALLRPRHRRLIRRPRIDAPRRVATSDGP
jgi:hypothetical protein